ncbi:hypothetical protein HPB47_004327 [Ixodes persulcatus]|uniref:Uncharacterized protein n=1 Tax=Ixodes persulcatus TaxID=34615 RepID=A0AC60PHK7_IXOPE|nr:hypothetical protein HPB47_004327 [Ixodes persulcatus]
MEEMPCEDWTPTRYSKLCSAHFQDECFHQLGSKRSPPPERQPGSSTTQPSPGEAPEASAATVPGSSVKSTLETMPEYLSVRRHEASAATGPGSSAESTPDATLEDVIMNQLAQMSTFMVSLANVTAQGFQICLKRE